MKKVVCLLMVTTMILALSITAFARWEVCPDCNGRLVEVGSHEKDAGEGVCNHGIASEGYYVVIEMECEDCGHYEDFVEYPAIFPCQH